jgi:hypothetical protein
VGEQSLFCSSHARTLSYFNNSPRHRTSQGQELKLLEPYRKDLPPVLFTERSTAGDRRLRQQSRAVAPCSGAASRPAGRQGPQAGRQGGEQSFTILFDDRRWSACAAHVQLLQALGIDAVRTVDPAQYQHLTDDFDFDMLMIIYPQGSIPGNELRDYFTCAAARRQAAQYSGICNPAVDAVVERIVTAQDRQVCAGATGRRGAVASTGAELGQQHLPHRLIGQPRCPASRSAKGSISTLVGGRGEGRPTDAAIPQSSKRSMTAIRFAVCCWCFHPVQHHPHQLRGYPVRTGRPGGTEIAELRGKGDLSLPSVAQGIGVRQPAPIAGARPRSAYRRGHPQRCSASAKHR